MSLTLSNAFVTQYNDQVNEAYQRKGSKLRNTVRLQSAVKGQKVVFQKVGKGMAGRKARNGNVPIMNLDHDNVTVTMEDWYGAGYADDLDLLKTNIDERQVTADAGADALGRKVDDLIITALKGASNSVAVGTTGLTKAKILSAFETLNGNDVPDDGNRFAVVGAHQWNELMNLAEFKDSDYAGDAFPWLKGTQSRVWLGMTWMMHTGLPITSGTRKCFLYHRTAIGLGECQAVMHRIDWVPDKASWLIDNMLSAGAALIDGDGVVEIDCDDDAAIA